MDGHGVYNLNKTNTFSHIERLSFFTAMTSDTMTSHLSPRLQRHFSIINLPELADGPLTTIISGTLCALCGGMEGGGGMKGKTGEGGDFSGGCLESIIQSTVAVYLQVRDRLRESDMPGRQHYTFSLKHIELAFQV